MSLRELFFLIRSDIQRVKSTGSYPLLHIELRQLFWIRIGSYLYSKHNVISRFFLVLIKLIQIHYHNKTGIEISSMTSIGKGLRIAHIGSIVVVGSSRIGSNCTIHQCVTIGRSFAGKKSGCPVIGNNVIIFTGASIIGNVKVGDNAVIGANALVINDVPANSIVGGVPAKILSLDSSSAIDAKWSKYFFPMEP